MTCLTATTVRTYLAHALMSYLQKRRLSCRRCLVMIEEVVPKDDEGAAVRTRCRALLQHFDLGGIGIADRRCEEKRARSMPTNAMSVP